MFFHLANNNNSIRVAVYCIIHILTTGGNGFHHKLYKHYCCNKFENCEHGETLRCPLSWSKFIVAQLQQAMAQLCRKWEAMLILC